MEPAATGRPAYAQVLPRAGESAKAARRLVQHALGAWALDELVDDASLVVTELVANAAHHARGDSIRVTISRLEDGGAKIAVTDRSKARPVRRAADLNAVNGRGLLLVDAVATRWGTEAKPWGKQTWAEVR
ncbi:ATP-binding protein [Streptomyces sp. NPDC049954]|uniref:ATP-binding protein n=1 Tax=Streptomyces sp. NPDC049954 TaxID=3155779 RepID=UPI00342BC5FE